jgi:hypothetical protein
MPEFTTLKTKKKGKSGNSYTFRFREKFTMVEDFDDLVEAVMYDTHKGIYLPLTMHLLLKRKVPHLFNETYLRMLRIPVTMHRRRPRPAFDDYMMRRKRVVHIEPLLKKKKKRR